LSGLHVARWVKEHRPELPVFIATGYPEMIAEEDYYKARIDDVIRKPYSVADVLARANAVLLLPTMQAGRPFWFRWRILKLDTLARRSE
jgi:DNA-binding response OmpR family regulator